MRCNKLALWIIVATLIAFVPQVLAQRGGRGGAGGSRGGAGGASMQRGGSGGGFGGGLSSRSSPGESERQRSSAGPYSHGAGGPESGIGARPGAGAGRLGVGGPSSGVGARPGAGAGRPGVGGPDSGVGARPGAGAGRPGAGGPDSGIGFRPGAGAGRPGVGGPVSGIGVRPGAGAGRPGLGGPDSGIGVRPGMGAGRDGVPGAYAADRPYGTRYASAGALADQGAAVRDAADRYPYYNPARLAGYANAWRPASFAANSLYANPGYAATAAMIGLAAQPIPYDYGGNVVAQSNAVYVNGDSAGTPQDYSQQASQIASAGGQADGDDKWLPIGVFALVEGNETNSDDIFQIAVNSQGVIKGNYHDMRSNQVTPISGSVDKQTQRAAWTIGGDQNPVYEAGIANLTKDETPLLVHVGDGQTRQVNLIRLPEPPHQDQSGGQ